MPAAIIKGAAGQPGPASYPNGIDKSIFNELNYIVPQYIEGIIAKYGNSAYALIADILGAAVVEEANANTNTFSHFEKGRIFGSILVSANVTTISANAAVTFVAKSPESYTDGATGTKSPVQINQIVKIRSNGVKGRVTAVDRTSAGAFSITALPLATGSKFASGSSTTLSAGEGIEILDNQLAGEASDTQGTIQSKKYRYDNTATVLRSSVSATDLAGMTKTQIGYEPVFAVDEMNKRMLYSIEDAVLEGVPYGNTSDTGTVGVIPDVTARGSEIDYVVGSLGVSDFQNVTNVLDANGGPREYHGLQHLSQRQEFNTMLFGKYTNGAISYGSVGFSQEAAVSYGFKGFSMDTFDFHFHRYKGFGAQAMYGYVPNNTLGDYRANFGLFVPQGMTQDAGDNSTRPYMQFVYQNNPDFPGKKIYSWELGYTKGTKTTKASNSYHQICYVGSRTVAAEQFVIMKGVAS